MLPKNITSIIARQDLPVLYEIRDLVQSLIADKEQPAVPQRTSGREVLDTKKSGAVTYRLERVSCGKGCKGCPHGPYWYGYWKEGGKTRSKYIGKRLTVP